MIRRDYSATSYSPLTQITAGNASRLELAWMWPMREGGFNQPAPLVYNGTMYLANTGGIVQALNARTGQLIWEHAVGAEVAPRGLALYGTRLIFHSAAAWALNRQDGYLMALDARTGETAWRVRMPDAYASNSGPIVANGLIVQGMGTCQIYEENKCFISAYDPETGQQRWRFRTIARSGEPGGDTWGRCRSLSRRRGAWITGRLRPELNLTYWGTTQAKPWMPASRGMATDDCGALHELHGGARRLTGKARLVLPARARRKRSIWTRCSSASSSMPAASAGCSPSARTACCGRTIGRRAHTKGTSRRSSRTCGSTSIPRPARPRYRPDILAPEGRRVDRRVPEHGRRQELARDELSSRPRGNSSFP
jgi:hypothetical protein